MIEIDLPASKSLTNRALIIAHLAGCPDVIQNIAQCEDSNVMLSALNELTVSKETYLFDIKNAGTAMRFLTSFLAQRKGTYVLKGSERMHQRPIGVLVETLKKLGANISYLEKEGFPPLRIEGKELQGGEVEISGEVSSQFISSLLMIAPCMKNGLTLHLQGKCVSIPYIQMTLNIMRHFGIHSSWENATLCIPPQNYQKTAYEVENDWSAASYWFAASALFPQCAFLLKGLEQESWQGDSKAIKLYELLGIRTRSNTEKNTIFLQKEYDPISYLSVDFSEMPDLVQTFVPLCCLLGVPFRFSGLQTLRIKETDRIDALLRECRKLGFVVQENEANVLEWKGEKTPFNPPITIFTYNDHRMAMGFAPFLLLQEGVSIEKPEVVGKSYPHFWEEWKKLETELKKEK